MEEVEGTLIPSAVTWTLTRIGLLLALGCGCASSRQGWSGGRHVVLMEEPFLQIRRARQVVDEKTGDVVAAWVGARTPEGEPRLVECEIVLFADANANGTPDPGEIRAHRGSRESAVKVLFADVRASAEEVLLARIDVRTERKTRSVTWRFVAD